MFCNLVWTTNHIFWLSVCWVLIFMLWYFIFLIVLIRYFYQRFYWITLTLFYPLITILYRVFTVDIHFLWLWCISAILSCYSSLAKNHIRRFLRNLNPKFKRTFLPPQNMYTTADCSPVIIPYNLIITTIYGHYWLNRDQ